MRVLTLAAACLLLAGCATAGNTGERGDRREITQAEIEATANAATAYDIVRRLRPEWLRVRGTGSFEQAAEEGVLVYVDGVRAGLIGVSSAGGQSTGRSALESVPASSITELRFYSATEANRMFGSGTTNGAIAVTTR